jgi:oligoribonuclease (3'-5' exoribonuclease)
MTGLGDEHVILEVAIIITDEKLNIVDKFLRLLIILKSFQDMELVMIILI